MSLNYNNACYRIRKEVFKIKIRTFISITLAKFLIKISNLVFKGGTNFPGRVALKIDPDILQFISKDYETILVTGTNGKTTTTSMIYNIIKESSQAAITNNTGANMQTGIISCYIQHFSFKKNISKSYAIIEVDEANLTYITKQLKPKYIIVTNLFRDQMDRYGEVYTTLHKILEGIENTADTELILNGDESLLGNLKLQNKKHYYGFNCSPNKNTLVDINADAKFCVKCGHPYEYELITYNHLGNYHCKNCGYKRPALQYSVDKIIDLSPKGSHIVMNGQEYYINQPGTYNIYNALCALSVAKLLKIDTSVIFNSLKSQKSSFGRQEYLKIYDKEVKIILVKNPAGYDEAINSICLSKNNVSLAFILNDNYADSRDVSWIWDVNFEKLKELSLGKIMVSGLRMYDMAIRLKVSGITENPCLCLDYNDLLNNIKIADSNDVYILATYTAMISLRRFLYKNKLIKKLW